MAKYCCVPGCFIQVSQSQEFCARCWSNVPPKDQYMVAAAREQLHESATRLRVSLDNARALAAARMSRRVTAGEFNEGFRDV